MTQALGVVIVSLLLALIFDAFERGLGKNFAAAAMLRRREREDRA